MYRNQKLISQYFYFNVKVLEVGQDRCVDFTTLTSGSRVPLYPPRLWPINETSIRRSPNPWFFQSDVYQYISKIKRLNQLSPQFWDPRNGQNYEISLQKTIFKFQKSTNETKKICEILTCSCLMMYIEGIIKNKEKT